MGAESLNLRSWGQTPCTAPTNDSATVLAGAAPPMTAGALQRQEGVPDESSIILPPETRLHRQNFRLYPTRITCVSR